MLTWIVVLLTLLLPAISSAQNMWGSGVYGGMQSCAYPTQAGNGATSVDDGTKEIQQEIAEAQKQLRTKKSEKKKIDRDAERAKEDVANTLGDDYEDFVFEHIENSRRCQEYKGYKGAANAEEPSVTVQEGDEPIADANITPIQGFKPAEWSQYCDGNKAGGVSGSICTVPKFKEVGGEKSDVQSCKKGLIEYRKTYSQSSKIQREIESLENKISRGKESLVDARKDAAEERKNQTEAGVCIECMQQGNNYQAQQQPSQTNWGNVIANVGTGLFASYMGYQQNKMVSENNANLGWPTQSYPAASYGYPYLQAGIYGAVSGATGSGTFGCGNGMNGTGNANGPLGMMGAYGMGSPYGSNGANGGAFGYPNGMMGNSMGGGMYNSGMGPWGMNGMSGNPMMMGNMGSGNMMSGYGNMMGGYGSMMGSMMGSGSMMGGYGNMMGSMMGYDASSMQYQQQMMQLQQQQYQSYMQKYQTVSSLQQEMYSLMSRIQSVQYGGTSYLGGSLGTSSNYYSTGSSVLTPISTSYSGSLTTPIPSAR